MKLGVLLLNLGGPSDISEVKPFLVNLFSDPDILPVPFSGILQKPLAHLIAAFRVRMSEGYYRDIGGGSPLKKITLDQAAALEERLKTHIPDARVYVGMRYWKPSIEDAWQVILKDERTELVVLPLYPHYSQATTRSSYRTLDQAMRKTAHAVRLIKIENWHTHSRYIEAFSELIQKEVDALPQKYRKKFHLIFSAHSLPMKLIRQGDPYEKQIRESIELILKKLKGVQSWHLSYQSQTGFIKWLGPSTSDLLARLSVNPDAAIIMVPVSFVSDHVETLYEIDILYKDEARALGFPCFKRVASLNTFPLFIEALEELVLTHLRQKNLI